MTVAYETLMSQLIEISEAFDFFFYKLIFFLVLLFNIELAKN